MFLSLSVNKLFLFSLLFEALQFLASGRFLRYLSTEGMRDRRQTWQAESGWNTQFGTNCGRLPDAFRADKQSGVCRCTALRTFVSENPPGT